MPKGKASGVLILLILSPLIVFMAALMMLFWLIVSAIVFLSVLLTWRTRGVSFLIVYSDSAQWKSYFEEELIPAFGSRARILNLSTDGGRKKWWQLDWLAYRHCARGNHFPVILRFSPLGFWKSIWFYGAFFEAKKGKPQALEKSKALATLWASKSA